MSTLIKKFLGPVTNSEKDKINTSEIVRSSVLSVVSYSTIWAILSIIWELIQTFVTDPNFATNFKYLVDLLNDKNYLALFIAGLTFVADFLRRKYVHGK